MWLWLCARGHKFSRLYILWFDSPETLLLLIYEFLFFISLFVVCSRFQHIELLLWSVTLVAFSHSARVCTKSRSMGFACTNRHDLNVINLLFLAEAKDFYLCFRHLIALLIYICWYSHIFTIFTSRFGWYECAVRNCPQKPFGSFLSFVC